MDALTLANLPDRFDTVIDSGLFHVFSNDDRQRYVDGLASVLKPVVVSTYCALATMSQAQIGPRRVSEDEIRETFANGWQIQSIKRSRYEVRPDPNDPSFKDGGRRHGLWW